MSGSAAPGDQEPDRLVALRQPGHPVEHDRGPVGVGGCFLDDDLAGRLADQRVGHLDPDQTGVDAGIGIAESCDRAPPVDAGDRSHDDEIAGGREGAERVSFLVAADLLDGDRVRLVVAAEQHESRDHGGGHDAGRRQPAQRPRAVTPESWGRAR